MNKTDQNRKESAMGGDELGSSSTAINSSNIGFQLLKKCGWTEGTGLGVSEQGRLAPVQVHVKNDKSGLGAEKVKKRVVRLPKDPSPRDKDDDTENLQARKKAKTASKRIRKMLEEEKAYQEKEFERAFFREFWPENV